MQPRRGRRGQGADRPRNRRAGRPHGAYHRPHDTPIPDAQPLEGSGHVEPARAVRQRPFFGRMAARTGKYAEPLYLAGYGRRTALRHGRGASPRDGRAHVHGRRVHGARRDPHGRHLPRRHDVLRRSARAGRTCRRSRFDGHHCIARRDGIRNGAHEDRYPRTTRRPHDRLRGIGAAIRRRKSVKVFIFH